MKDWGSIHFDTDRCRTELEEFGDLLRKRQELAERDTVLPFFRARRHLAAAIGLYSTYLNVPDRIAFEYDLFGDFRPDLVVGDEGAGEYCFVEFEEGGPGSVFRSAGRSTSLWSPRFEAGFSQVVDWMWKLDDMEGTRAYAARFGTGQIGYQGVLVVGRGGGMSDDEVARLRWRRERVTVHPGKNVVCVTYDDLYAHLKAKLLLSGRPPEG